MLRGQLIHYPPPAADAPPAQFGVAPHTDFGCITLLLQETAGLEVLLKGGEWTAVPPQAGTLVVNIGDLLERWTDGRYASTRHRVRNLTGEDRFSIAIFHDPDPLAVVDPRDMAPGVTARFAPVEAGAYILQRIQGAFAHYDPAIKDGLE
jgi:isopenicillin N synthase-like dioxygenase